MLDDPIQPGGIRFRPGEAAVAVFVDSLELFVEPGERPVTVFLTRGLQFFSAQFAILVAVDRVEIVSKRRMAASSRLMTPSRFLSSFAKCWSAEAASDWASAAEPAYNAATKMNSNFERMG
jgi:hypothetical protein